MAFDLKAYIRQKQKDQDSGQRAETTPSTQSVGGGGASGGFDLRSYVKRRDISAGKLQKQDQDYISLMDELSGFSTRMGKDYTQRRGSYQSADAFQAYRSKTDQEIADLLARGERALDYYKTWGADYDKAYGEGRSRSILDGLDQGMTYLEQVRGALGKEGDYWGSYADEGAWLRGSKRLVDNWELQSGGDEGEDIDKGLERTRRLVEAGQRELEMLEATYILDPTEEHASAYKDAYARFQGDLEGYNTYASRSKKYYTPEMIQGRIDKLNAQLAEMQPELEEKAERARITGGSVVRYPGQGIQEETGYDEAKAAYDAVAEKDREIRSKIRAEEKHKTFQEKFAQVIGMPDFDELAKPGESRGNYGKFLVGPFDDAFLYDFINDLGAARSQVGFTDDDGRYRVYRGESRHGGSYQKYLYMTPDEVKLYNAIDKVDGAAAAKEYLDYITEELNWRQGVDNYQEMPWLGKATYWLPAGLDQFAGGVAQLFSEEALPTSPVQVTSSMVREEAHDTSPVLGFAYDLGTTSANMAPSVLTSMAVGLINPAAGAVTGDILMGASAAGNAYNQKVKEGYSKDQARTYAVLVGASEACLQYLLGGVGQLGGVSETQLLSKIAQIDSGFARFALTMGVHGLSEGMEEGLQEILEPAFASIIFGEDYEVDPGDVIYSALMGFAMGDVFALPGEVGAQVRDSRTGKAYQAMGGDVDALVAQGLKQAPGSEVYQQALAAQRKMEGGRALSNGDVGRLYQSGMGAVESELYAAAVLADAQETYVRKGSVGQDVVNAILENPAARAQIAQETGIELEEGMSKGRTTRAVNEALGRMARADGNIGPYETNAAKEMVQNRSRGETAGVIQKLKESIPNISKDAPVANVSVSAVDMVSGHTMAEKAKTLFSYIKGLVMRDGFGDVEINSRSIKDDLSHGIGPAKAAVIPAIPEIIRKGKQIDVQEKWKGRAYDGYVFAAPIIMDGETVYVAAVVKRTSKNRFYLHEVVDSKGNIIKMGNGNEANQTSLAAENGDAGTLSPLLETSIPPSTRDVKATEARVRELERGIAELDAQQVERGAADLGMQGKSTVAGMYLEGQNAQLYVQGMRELYQAGLDGAAMDAVDSRAVQSLNEHQRRAAYAAGQVDATANSQTLGNMEGGEDLPSVKLERMGERGRAGLEAAVENRRKLDGFGDELTEAGLREGYMDLYLAGLNGVALDAEGLPEMAGPNAKRLMKSERRFAYENGRQDAAAQVRENKRRAQFATVAGKEKGLVWSEWVDKNLSRVEADRMNALAKRLNVRVAFVESIANGRANGQIVEADIRIAQDAQQPAMVVFGHEVGHYLERIAPEEYQTLRRFTEQRHREEIEGLMELYDQAGMERSYDEILKERVNDDIGKLIADPKAMESFIEANKSNRTLLQKVREALRALWQRLTGKDRQQVKTAEEALAAALKASEAQAEKLEKAGQTQDFAQAKENESVEYSLKQFSDGLRFVEVNTDQAQFDGLEDREKGRLATQIIKEKFAGKVIGLDNQVFVNGRMAGEYGFPLKKLSSDLHDAKMRASTELDNLVDAGTNFRTAPDGADGHTHPRMTGEFQYFDTIFKVGGDYYTGVVNVMPVEKGLLLKDITKIRNITQDISSSYGTNPKSTFLRDVSMPTVTQPTENVNGDFSLKGSEVLEREVSQATEQARQEGLDPAAMEEEIRTAVQRALQSLVEEYGAIKPGESPAREVQVPRKTGKHDKVSQTVRTILEAKATPEVAVPTIEELTARGEFSYQALSDKTAMERAAQTIEHKGWGQSLGDWFQAVKNGVVSKENTAMGWALYNQAVNAGDVTTAVEIIQRMVRHQRNAAQAVQATRILKQLSPEAQLYAAQRSVESLQEEINERYGDEKGPKLVISEELARRLLEAGDQEARDGVLRDIYRDIGRQMPSTFLDKWNAWRYLSMLGNARTHVRNIVGNAGFMPVVAVKDMTATAIERAVYAVSGGKLERSKALVGLGEKGRSLLAAAWGDYAKVQDAAMGGGKYGEFQSANRYIEEGRVVFKSKPGKALEVARKANSKALDVEDMWFSKPHYAYAMAQYCAAKGITAETVRAGDAKALEAARAYAIKEAQKATYRDTNALSQMLGGLGRDLRRSKNLVSRGMGVAVEGILPFRKTPANILARGLEYSPMGLVKGLSYDLWQVHQGNMTGAEAIDNISAGLTGTGLLALGTFLAALGVLRGKGPEDDKEREMAQLQGHQDYALELGDISITLDWLAPEALPLFVGVNLWETAQEQEGEVTMSGALGAVSMVSDPLLEMSCLQSLNDIFDSVGYASGNDMNPLTSALVSAATSYLTQGLPTVFGQAERVFETQRESTYTSKDAFLTGDMQYFLGNVSGKVPFWEFQQVPWVDAWGRTEETGGLGERAFNNLLNPAYVSEIETSPMEEELVRLYEATGENVFPSRARKYFQVDGTRRDLDAEEYVDYATRKGQTARRVVEALVGDRRYGGLEDGEKAEAVKDAYQYAEQTARRAVAKDYVPDSWVVKAQQAEKEYKIPVEVYILLRGQTAGLESIRDKNGEAIPNSKGLQIMEVVYAVPGLGDRQRGYLFEALGAGKSIRHYNKALVQEKLGKMRKKK